MKLIAALWVLAWGTTCGAASAETVLAMCGSGEGYEYKPQKGTLPDNLTGWRESRSDGFITKLVLRDDGSIDIKQSAYGGEASELDRGTKIEIIRHEPDEVALLVRRPAEVHIMNFIQQANHHDILVNILNRGGSILASSTIQVSDCVDMRLSEWPITSGSLPFPTQPAPRGDSHD